MSRLQRMLLVCGLLLIPGSASAQLGCWVGMGSIQFGDVNQVGQPNTDVTGTMNVGCSNASTPYVRVCIALGAPVDASWDPRYLAGTQQQGMRLAYNIYTDAARTQIWGSAYSTAGRPRAVDLAMSYGSANTDIPYYARVPAQNDAVADQYNATFTYANDAAVRAQGYSGSPPACSSSMPIVSRFEFGVWATVQPDCTVSASTLDFGTTGTNLETQSVEAASTITMRCTKGVNYNIALDAGVGNGATVAQRKMTHDSGGATLPYQLFRDPARTQPWGDGSSGTSTVSATGAGTQVASSHTVYGRLLPQSSPAVGQYHDTVTVTVTY